MDHDDKTKLDLRSALRQFEIIPDEHRLTLWKTLLQLPGNRECYLRLRRRRHEIEFVGDMADPVNDKTFRNVFRSLIVHSPSLERCSFLRDFLKPFESVCIANELAFFEIALSVLFNQCQRWFDDVPHPPHPVLMQLDIILLEQDPRLYRHLVGNGVRSEHYAWQWMQSAYSSVMHQNEWPRLWDHILCNEPSFFYCVPAAVCKLQSQPLLASSSREDLLEILQRPSGFDHVAVVREAYKISDRTPERYHPRAGLRDFVQLPVGVYPTICPTEKVSLDPGSSLNTEQLLHHVEVNSAKVDAVLREGFSLRIKLLDER